jgi:hypothetical protein
MTKPPASTIIAALPIPITIGAIRLRSATSASAAADGGGGSGETKGDNANRIMAVTPNASASATASFAIVGQSTGPLGFGTKSENNHRSTINPAPAETNATVALVASLLNESPLLAPRD